MSASVASRLLETVVALSKWGVEKKPIACNLHVFLLQSIVPGPDNPRLYVALAAPVDVGSLSQIHRTFHLFPLDGVGLGSMIGHVWPGHDLGGGWCCTSWLAIELEKKFPVLHMPWIECICFPS